MAIGGGPILWNVDHNGLPSVSYTSGSTSTMAPPKTVPTWMGAGNLVGYTEYKDSKGDSYRASQVQDDVDKIRTTAAWVGARVHGLSGLRVPTLEGVEVAFVGDWVVRDTDGIVYIYTDEDFKREFRQITARDF